MGIALDSTFFIDLERWRPFAYRKLEEIEGRADPKIIPTPVAYEIWSGILRVRSQTKATQFRGWLAKFLVAPLDLASAEKAALLRVELQRLGRTKGTGDILAAGIALAGNHRLVTRDTDFLEISEATGLLVEPYV